MNAQDANIALQFLQRVNLQPAEIQAFQQCCNSLQAVIQKVQADQAQAALAAQPDEAA